MLEILKKIVSKYVSQNADMNEWRSVRKNYFWYSYLVFLNIYLSESGSKMGDYEKLAQKQIIDQEALWHIKGLKDSYEIALDMKTEFDAECDINQLYQEYISMEFFVSEDGAFGYEKGKTSRDILGAYYTEKDFAYEIVENLMRKFVEKNIRSGSIRDDGREIKELLINAKYVDSSCGAGEFLIAAARYIKNNFVLEESEIDILAKNIYGYDIDPIAVLITRIRIKKELGTEQGLLNIQLGNPIIPRSGKKVSYKYSLAAEGRFYNLEMGIPVFDQEYTVIVGNPPWEKIRFEEKKFLYHFIADKRIIDKKSERDQYVNSHISAQNRGYYNCLREEYDLFKTELKDKGFLKRSAVGELNTYALFTEWGVCHVSLKGVIGLIVKSSLLKAPVYREFFSCLLQEHILNEAYMFSNKKKIFQIDSREEFSVIYLNCENTGYAKIAVDLSEVKGFGRSHLLEISEDILESINPISRMIPGIKTEHELRFLIKLCSTRKMFQDVYPECKFGRIVHLTNHSRYIERSADKGYLPIYEGKFIEQYNNRYATYREVEDSERYKGKSKAKLIIGDEEYPESRYFIDKDYWNKLSGNFTEEYSVVWRSLTAASNRRTMIATLLPKIPTCQSIQLLQTSDKNKMIHILALFNSIIFDYIVRMKLAGLDLTQTIIKQMPVPSEDRYEEMILYKNVTASIGSHIASRIKALYQNDSMVQNFFSNIYTYHVDKKAHKALMAEIDILMAKAYGIEDAEFQDIIKHFARFYSKKEAERFFRPQSL